MLTWMDFFNILPLAILFLDLNPVFKPFILNKLLVYLTLVYYLTLH